MTEMKLIYRVFRLGPEWHWQVMEVTDDFREFLASNITCSGRKARVAALSFCLRYQSHRSRI